MAPRLAAFTSALPLLLALGTACSGAPDTEDGVASNEQTDDADAASGSPGSGGVGGGSAVSSTGATGGSSGSGGHAVEWGPDQCPAPENVGVEVGQQLPHIQLLDCDGQRFSLDELCGAEALWIFAAHGWCPLCQSVSAQAEAIHQGFAGQGLASVNVVVADGQGDPPTAEYCKLWRDEHGLVQVRTLYDPTGEILALWSGTTSLSAFVSADRIIVSKLEHDSSVEHIQAGIAEALGD